MGRVPPAARLVYGAEPWPAPRHPESSLFTVLTPDAASRRLDRQDKGRAYRAYLRAGAAPIGQTIEWNNPRTGNYGTIVAVRDGISQQGRYCREFEQSVTVGGHRQDAYGVACQQPDGSWQLARR